jgi:hypothetical protein
MSTVIAREAFEKIATRALSIIEQRWALRLERHVLIEHTEDWWTTLEPHMTWLERFGHRFVRARETALWQRSAAWFMRLHRIDAILIRSPRSPTANSIRDRLFVLTDEDTYLKWTICHELTHAVTKRLGLPFWLNEGIAMLTTDFYAGKPTILEATRQLKPVPLLRTSAGLASRSSDFWLQQYAQAYWKTRFLFETQPEALRRALQARNQKLYRNLEFI